MKKTVLLTLLTWIFVVTACAWAQVPAKTDIQIQELVYGATIDSKVAFYQKRIYLSDSPYQILADIGKDAVQKVAFLKSKRQALIKNMMTKNIKLKESSLNSFIVSEMNSISTTMEAYSKE